MSKLVSRLITLYGPNHKTGVNCRVIGLDLSPLPQLPVDAYYFTMGAFIPCQNLVRGGSYPSHHAP